MNGTAVEKFSSEKTDGCARVEVSNQSENWYFFAAFGVLSTVAFAYYCNKPKGSHLELLLEKEEC